METFKNPNTTIHTHPNGNHYGQQKTPNLPLSGGEWMLLSLALIYAVIRLKLGHEKVQTMINSKE